MIQDVCCFEPPLADDLQSELPPFWEAIFEEEFDFRDVLAGSDAGYIGHRIYLRRQPGDGALMGTSHLAYSEHGLKPQREMTPIGGMGEVATAPAFRRMGIAAQLCAMARDEFAQLGGAALFLGTGNPAAARVYHRLGFRKLAGASLMAWVTDDESPECFLASHFSAGGSIEVHPGSPRSRCHLIPLAVCPHDWQVLDANAGLYSTRYTQLNSCMSLFPRYEAVATGEREGTWFEGWTETGGCLAGLSTVRQAADRVSQVDGFVHKRYEAAWPQLLAAAIDWSRERGMDRCMANICVEDEEKQVCFKQLGFVSIEEGGGFEVGGRRIGSILMERAL